jgi:NhaP-type Na+/H+ or K+/H+ antiporter
MILQQLNLALVLIGGVVLLLGLFSNLIKRFYLSEPLVAMVVGIILGPVVSGLIHVNEWGNSQALLEQTARLTLAIGLMGVALRLPRDFLTRYWRPIAVLLGVVMVLMWVISGLLTYAVLAVPFWVAMLLGATVTPTDPVLASTIVTGRIAERDLPQQLRDVLSSESGANDGLAYLFVFLAIYALTYPAGEIVQHWLTTILLREVFGGLVFGFLLGYGSGHILRWAESKRTIGMTSFLAYTLALALVALGVSYLIGSDGLLAVFVAGAAFSLTVREEEKERHEHREHFQEAVNRFFILPVFVLFGMALPWQDWLGLGWGGIGLACLVLLLRRLPAVLTLNWALGSVRGLKNALFIGWFGPIGVAAIYYATLSQRLMQNNQIWVVASLIVFASIIIHGLTSTPLTALYGKYVIDNKGSEYQHG